jgi:hypothetical protein
VSRAPTGRSPDVQRLVDEGYSVVITDCRLIVHDIPYVDERRTVQRGTLVALLQLADDVVLPPSNHGVYWKGGGLHDHAGRPLDVGSVLHLHDHGGGLQTNRTMCQKPPGREFRDYHELVTAYTNLLAGHARRVDPSATARTHMPVVKIEPSRSPFMYADTATARAGVSGLSERLEGGSVGIVGLGGTGSYVLDLVAKTPVGAIHLFDDDLFLQHNAFRAPGAAAGEDITARRTKVDHFAGVYSRMHRGIVPHRQRVGPGGMKALGLCDFVFLCIDEGGAKRQIIDFLERQGTPFVDVGMGLVVTDEGIRGSVRVTTSTPGRRDHVRDAGRIPFANDGERDVYATNVQIADLNMLNAALAVIRWKRLRGFYADLEGEHHAVFDVAGNALLNADRAAAG